VHVVVLRDDDVVEVDVDGDTRFGLFGHGLTLPRGGSLYRVSMTSTAWIRKKRHAIPLAFLALGLVVTVVAELSPWPSVLLIRALFDDTARKTVAEMTPYVPTSGIEAKLDVADDHGTTFDVFSPSGSTGALPTVIWIHGGAWISGSKENVDPYAKIIASHGYTTVALNYTVAPEASYPVALTQLNDALGFLVAHAAEYRIDPGKLVIAGDSAGAQYTAQLATLVTSPAYASTVGIVPTLTSEQLRGVILNCGIYDVSGIPDAPGLGGWGFRVSLWAYLGTKDWSNTPGGDAMSTLDDVTGDFPPTWISGGNADPLTKNQSKPMAARLTALGVPVTSVFYPDDTTPALPHEYQFHLDDANAQSALASTLEWLGKLAND
ncbi:MAG: alpha/beta hydrolase, partial [Rhodoglobus sp.]